MPSNGGGNGKDGYSFTLRAGRFDDGSLAAPLSLNSTGTRAFCSDQTGVTYYKGGAPNCDSGTGTPLQ
jgi:hypothetical protein